MKKKVCEGRISSGFGMRIHPITRATSFHNGIDISCPVGTGVYTPVAAYVAQVYNHETGGRTIVLRDLKTNDRYGFCHLSLQKVDVGQIIPAGYMIALSGNTGRSSGPHLHFSYATGGKWNGNICINYSYQDPTEKIEFEV